MHDVKDTTLRAWATWNRDRELRVAAVILAWSLLGLKLTRR